MKKILRKLLIKSTIMIALINIFPFASKAQSDFDAIMMAKHTLCTGPMYSYSSWNDYWEGTYKRDNGNLGKVSTQMISVMADYGITKRLNVLVGAPYVWTKATEGTLHGQRGIQDFSLSLKWIPYQLKKNKNTFSVITVGGFSTPLSNYIADYLPLSIGVHSTTFSGRLMLDFTHRNFFITTSASYTYRNDITIDRNSYYTTQLYLTDKVDMPDVAMYNFRAGLRSKKWIAEAVLSNMTTLGGFDIRKNDMPFPSNKMDMTTAGAHFKYTYKKRNELQFLAGVDYTVAGKNTGQATMFSGGVTYAFNVIHKTTKPLTNETN